jgi:nicotinate-nucleotide adenylyltransferase
MPSAFDAIRTHVRVNIDSMSKAIVPPQRVAFFGGSFDPPHLGHLAVARVACEALALDTVLFVPVGAQPLKSHGSTAGFQDRVSLTRLAIADEPGFAVSLADAPKPSGTPNYTIDTLLALRAELPPGSTLFCLMGADSFLGLRYWHRAAEIPFIAPLIVASRPGPNNELGLDDLMAALPRGLTIETARDSPDIKPGIPGSGIQIRSYVLQNPAGAKTPFYFLPALEVAISASQIRERFRDQIRGGFSELAKGHQQLPEAVFQAIRFRGLYR